MTGSIRNFKNKNFTPKSRIFVSLKVKLPDMTDWHKFLTNGANISIYVDRFEMSTTSVLFKGVAIGATEVCIIFYGLVYWESI